MIIKATDVLIVQILFEKVKLKVQSKKYELEIKLINCQLEYRFNAELFNPNCAS